MSFSLIPSHPSDLVIEAGHAANKQAARRAFPDHLLGKSQNTIRRKRADIALFESFLNEQGIPARGLFKSPQSWTGITWGLVKEFVYWQLRKGYAIPSLNGRLSTVKTFAKLAYQSGVISESESLLIAGVRGYSNKEAKHINDERAKHHIQTRIGHKKAEPTVIPSDIADRLKHQADTPKGRRDALLICILTDHGLRIGEIAALTRKGFDLKNQTLSFYREKVHLTQTHDLTQDTLHAAIAYLEKDAPQSGILWRRARKNKDDLGKQIRSANATRSITKWVNALGLREGIPNLSGHDFRHYWATYEVENGTPINKLKQAGGWNSLAMPDRYIKAAEIANEGTARVKYKHE